MRKEKKLVNKVKRLLKVAGIPKWLHHYGPKKFRFWQLALGLLIKEVFRLSYRRSSRFFEEFYGIRLHWTTLQKYRARIPLSIWHDLLSCTIENPIDVAAIDGTTFQRSNPSDHYLKRIDSKKRINPPIQLNAMVDVIRRKFIFARHHPKQAGKCRMFIIWSRE